ncbi:MAG: hypothetical protein KDK12_15300 [Rhodobacteraceae bacterium]|nr:hypothetical protein [Paracoccaceae bacterium]
MTDTRHLACRCGAMAWHVAPSAGGTHAVCYCSDCQTYARHLGRAGDFLDPHGGTEVFQTLPYNLVIDRGAEHLAMLRLGPKGLFRWYAGCCNTPIANTLPKPALPFVGLVLPPGARDFGPITARANTGPTQGKVRPHGVLATIFSLFARGIGARLSGRAASPFFTRTGEPIVAPRILTREERNAARP